MSEIFEEVKTIIADELNLSEEEKLGIKMETRIIEDLKADSMEQFYLIESFSTKFGAMISDKDAQGIKTVGDVVTFIETKKNIVT
jgi:acyl carrier protein